MKLEIHLPNHAHPEQGVHSYSVELPDDWDASGAVLLTPSGACVKLDIGMHCIDCLKRYRSTMQGEKASVIRQYAFSSGEGGMAKCSCSYWVGSATVGGHMRQGGSLVRVRAITPGEKAKALLNDLSPEVREALINQLSDAIASTG
jgi:hypothetical protein